MRIDPSVYGEGLADIYDLIYPETPEAGMAAAFVRDRTPEGGSVLEFGVGTGRIALPMADLGLRVHGVDASQRMLDVLMEKAGDREITSALGDFTTVDCGGVHDTVLIAINTLFMVPSQEQQIACFENARRHLKDEGRLVIEVYEPTRFHSLPTGMDTMVQHLDRESLLLCSIQVDKVNQIAALGQAYLRSGELRKTPEISRYAWPAELDLMARVAGMRLVERYEDWLGSAFEHRSHRHISVYEPVTV
ncbi:class I SAM-dependent methyltransferase [Nocardiopsis sp. N85]|uniref:class I SAM-dependent methyltransferase n=1 Tax=Nocardiopsis sp. N85 TaxID=3029400 RepID=UPI00237F50A5|nr:class I SAM-dependent methyltransferase [Nocardiopsis sp. N85]MDE3723109.1 class I SAM-dependent methyltransferase [Nocardiopsis sp. N85]